MNDVEREIRREFARAEARLTGPDFAPGGVPQGVLQRTRRRQSQTVAIALVAAVAVVAASVAGALALMRASEHRTPAVPEPISVGPLEAVAAQPVSFGGFDTADSDGNLWSTSSVLTRLDPSSGSLRTFTVTDDAAFASVADVAPARGGGVWILSPRYATEQTVRRLEGGGIVETLPPIESFDLRESFGAEIAEGPDGTIWRSGGEALLSWNGAEWATTPSAGNSTGPLAVDTAGNVWVASRDRPGPEWFGVARFDGTEWTTYGKEEVFGSDVGDPALNAVFEIVPGPAGDVWVGGMGAVAHLEGGAWTSYPMAEVGLLQVTSIAVTENAVWVGGVAAEGPPAVARFDGSTWTSVSDGLDALGWMEADTQVVATPEGPFGTTAAGLFRLDGTRWQPVLTDERPGFIHFPLAAAGADEVWGLDATNRGLMWRLQGDRWTPFGEADGVPAGEIRGATVAGDGTVWVAAAGGLASFDGTAWDLVDAADHAAVAVAPDGEVWAASGGAARGWTIGTVGGTSLPKLLDFPSIRSLAVDRSGRVWVGSADYYGPGGELAHFDGETWATLQPIEGVRDFDVTDIEVTADGGVWVAIAYDRDALVHPVVARYDGDGWTKYGETDEGIPLGTDSGDLELGMTPDGRFLLATGTGVFTLRDGTWHLVEAGAISMLSVAPDGTAWFGGDGGLFRLPPA